MRRYVVFALEVAAAWLVVLPPAPVGQAIAFSR